MAPSLMLPPATSTPIPSPKQAEVKFYSYQRRSFVYGLIGARLGLSPLSESAIAARRQPPPPPKEKVDPNVSGLQAKVLASKKRKEALKEEVARLREKGRPVS